MAFLATRTKELTHRCRSRLRRCFTGRLAAVRGRRLLAVTFFTLSFALTQLPPSVQGQAADEYEVKAAILLNFAKFIDWPTQAFRDGSGPLVIGVLGNDPFGERLDRVVGGKVVKNRPLIVKRLRAGQDIRDCHILFVSSSEQKRLPQILQSLGGASVLTVSEMSRFAQEGGVIHLTKENNRVAFQINVENAERARLKINSPLLALAKVVKGGN